MSASLYYQPVKGTHLPVGGGKSSFVELLTRVMESPDPWEIDRSRVERLVGAAAGTSDAAHRQALGELCEAIRKHGTIRVWAEY